MSREERERFLADTHVAIVSVAAGAQGPLAVPIWYRYEPGGEVAFVTDGNSRKAKLMREAGRATVVVQTEAPPYRYVTVEGPVTVGATVDWDRDIRDVALRYLGRELGETYLRTTAEDYASMDNVLVLIRPERWTSADFGKMARRG